MQCNKLCDYADLEKAVYRDALKEIRLEVRAHRKFWEYAHLLVIFDNLGKAKEENVCLGLGSGSERVIYALANRVGMVYATDLYDISSHHPTARHTEVSVYEEAPFPYRRDHLKVQTMDMTQITFPDNSIDVVFSCSSVEHVGSVENVEKVFREVERVLKPGGIAILITEWNLTGPPCYHHDIVLMDGFLLQRLLRSCPQLELLDPIDLKLSPVPENRPASSLSDPHMVLLFSNYCAYTSVALVLRKSPVYIGGIYFGFPKESWMQNFSGIPYVTPNEHRGKKHSKLCSLMRRMLP